MRLSLYGFRKQYQIRGPEEAVHDARAPDLSYGSRFRSHANTDWTTAHSWKVDIQQPAGIGAFGKVPCVTDPAGRIAAAEVIQSKRRNPDRLRRDMQVLKNLTLLAKREDDHGRLVRPEEVINLDECAGDDANAPFKVDLQRWVYGAFDKLTAALSSGHRYVPRSALFHVAMSIGSLILTCVATLY
jgi:hypothetical protein